MIKIVITVFFISLAIYWIALFPGMKAAHDFPYSSENMIASFATFPTAWNAYGGVFGQNQLSTLWAWPSNLIYGVGALLGLPFGYLVSLLGVLPVVVVGFWGMFYLSKIYIQTLQGRLIAAFFFIANTYILLVVDGGQLLWGLAYSLIPWCLYFFERDFSKNRISLITAIPVLFLSFSDFRALYLLALILLIRFLLSFIATPKAYQFKSLIMFFHYSVSCLLLVFLLHAYWIIPLLLSSSVISPANLVISTSNDFLQFTSLGHAILLLQPHWYLNLYGQLAAIRFEFLWLLSLVLVAIFSKKKLSFLLVLIILGIFLTKGTQPPYGEIYKWLMENIPGFFLFRDSSKFFSLIALGYSLMLGISFELIYKFSNESTTVLRRVVSAYSKKSSAHSRIRAKSDFVENVLSAYYRQVVLRLNNESTTSLRMWNLLTHRFAMSGYRRTAFIPGLAPLRVFRQSNKKFKLLQLLPVLIWLYLIWLVWPAYTNQMTGLLGFNLQVKQMEQINKPIAESAQIGRTVWIPTKPVLGYSDAQKVSLNGVDLVSLRPFAGGVKGTYETLNFLREASYSGELLAISGINKLVYSPPEVRKKYKVDEWDYYQLFWQQLKERQWLLPVDSNNLVFQIENAKPLFFTPEKTQLVIGSDQIYQDSTKSAELSLIENGWLFIEEYPELFSGDLFSKLPVFFYNKNKLDLTMQFTPHNNWYFLAKDLQKSPDSSGWWKRTAADFLNFKDFLIQKYGIFNQDFDLGGGWAIAEGESVKEINLVGNKGDYLLIRALESTRSGTLTIETDTQASYLVELKKPGDNIKWHLVGQISKPFSRLQLKTSGEITLLNTLTTISEKDFSEALKKQQNIDKLNLTNLDRQKNASKISFTKLNDDQYQLNISQVNGPTLMIFNQQFDPKWQLNGQASVPVYSIFNGFIVEKDGTYLLEYSPHQYMFWAGLVSLGSLLIIISYVVYRYYVYKKYD